VPLLVQIDKLVQLIESPVFTYLRLQLLEPERHPHLFKCLYGLLMLLPQSSAFVSLRNRLNAVNSAGFLHIAPKPSTVSNLTSTRSKLGREDIKWAELLSHFRSVQNKHEKARRQALGTNDLDPIDEYVTMSPSGGTSGPNGTTTRPPIRRKVTGGPGGAIDPTQRPPSRALSPLNPRARGLTQSSAAAPGPVPNSPTFSSNVQQRQSKRTLSLSRNKG